MAACPARLRLFDMLDAIAGIQRMAAAATAAADLNDDQWRAIERWLEIISEASRHIPEDMKVAESTVAWRQVADLGNFLRHVYERIDRATLWDIVQSDVPALRATAERLYAACKLPADPWP